MLEFLLDRHPAQLTIPEVSRALYFARLWGICV